jgi:hypothetical protein
MVTDPKKCALLTTDLSVVLHKHEPTLADLMCTFAALIAKNVTRDIKPEYWETLVKLVIRLMNTQYELESSRSIH